MKENSKCPKPRDAHTESAITRLPTKVLQLSESLVNPADET